MDRSTTDGEETRTHTVRPRWSWVALAVLVCGIVVIAVGDLGHSWTLMGIGVVLLVAGGGVALYGGLFYDVQGGSFSGQLNDVAEGNQREFPDPTTTRSEDEVKEDVHRRWLHEQ